MYVSRHCKSCSCSACCSGLPLLWCNMKGESMLCSALGHILDKITCTHARQTWPIWTGLNFRRGAGWPQDSLEPLAAAEHKLVKLPESSESAPCSSFCKQVKHSSCSASSSITSGAATCVLGPACSPPPPPPHFPKTPTPTHSFRHVYAVKASNQIDRS